VAKKQVKAVKQPAKGKKPAPGITLEQVVARIQQMMDPDSVVKHNDYLQDKAANRRQFDVTIRGHLGGRELLGVIECKDHSRKKGVQEIEAFSKKASLVNANFMVMVSKKGFTKDGMRLAELEGVGTLTLLPDDPADAGFYIGIPWYGRLYRWEDPRLLLTFVDKKTNLKGFPSDKVFFDGRPVLDWFLRELSTTYEKVTTVGDVALRAEFKPPRKFKVVDTEHEVEAIACVARRMLHKKQRWMRLTGDAFFDWRTRTLEIPAKGQITVHDIPRSVAEWEDYDGEIPPPGPLQLQIDTFLACIDLAKPVVDLSML
jgi:hypothetical protein